MFFLKQIIRSYVTKNGALKLTKKNYVRPMHTEDFNELYNNLDMLSNIEIINLFLDSQDVGLAATRDAKNSIIDTAETLSSHLSLTKEGRLIYAGAGTSGRLGVLDCSELNPTFGWPLERSEFLMAGGLKALISPVEGAEDNAAAGNAEVKNMSLNKADAVIAISASGSTPYTVAVCEAASAAGALTIALVNNDHSPILHTADCKIIIPSGAEAISGSTRMTAGTIQKVALNMLSTLTMIRLNRTYGSYMVDVQPTNDKLKKRAIKMVSEISHVDTKTALTALDKANYNPKVAILIAMGLNLSDSTALLTQFNGNLRQALTKLKDNIYKK